RPLLGFSKYVFLMARFDNAYLRWTCRCTVLRAVKLRQDNNAIYRMVDSTRDTKGKEEWTHNSNTTDRHFAIWAAAARPAPQSIVLEALRQPPPEFTTAHAQALLYSANPQSNSQAGTHQPEVGWDTLARDHAKRP